MYDKHDYYSKDQQFVLSPVWNGEAQKTNKFKGIQKTIENHGYIILFDKIKVFTSELAFLFWSEQISLQKMGSEIYETVNGIEYFNSYIEGYKNGEVYFEEKYKVSSDTLYGKNAEVYVNELCINYFFVEHVAFWNGWQQIKNQYPLSFDHRIMKQYGFYSGICSCVDELVKKYPVLFKTFGDCRPKEQGEENEDLLLGKSGSDLQQTENSVFQTKTPVGIYQIDTEKAEDLLKVLEIYFPKVQYEQLRETVSNSTNSNEKLCFLGYCNSLLDVFRKLIDSNIIAITQKKQIEPWIINNFAFKKGESIVSFKPETVRTVISTNKSPCKNPIIEIVDGQITKSTVLRKRKRNKH